MKLMAIRVWILAIFALHALSGCTTAGGSYEEGQAAYARGDYPAAYGIWRALANRGDGQASYRVADMHDFATGVEQDYALAAHYYRMAAERGHADAQFRLAGRYNDGQGVIKDRLTSLTWYMIALDNPELSRRNRELTEMYLGSFASGCALEEPRCRALQAEAQRRSEEWQARAK